MVVNKFNSIKNGQLIPDFFVFYAEVITACTERMRTGSGVDNDGIFTMFRPGPHLGEGSVQSSLKGLLISFRGEGHAATVTGRIFRDVQFDARALSDDLEDFTQ